MYLWFKTTEPLGKPFKINLQTIPSKIHRWQRRSKARDACGCVRVSLKITHCRNFRKIISLGAGEQEEYVATE